VWDLNELLFNNKVTTTYSKGAPTAISSVICLSMWRIISFSCRLLLPRAAVLSTVVYVVAEHFEADYLPLAATGEFSRRQRYHNDALPDRCGFIPLATDTGATEVACWFRWRYCRIINRCNILIKGTTFLELVSTCFTLSSLQDVNVIKKIKRSKIWFHSSVFVCL
jgi:hypothetical protein